MKWVLPFSLNEWGYFNIDKTSQQEQLVFNRIVSLRDSWNG